LLYLILNEIESSHEKHKILLQLVTALRYIRYKQPEDDLQS